MMAARARSLFSSCTADHDSDIQQRCDTVQGPIWIRCRLPRYIFTISHAEGNERSTPRDSIWSNDDSVSEDGASLWAALFSPLGSPPAEACSRQGALEQGAETTEEVQL